MFDYIFLAGVTNETVAASLGLSRLSAAAIGVGMSRSITMPLAGAAFQVDGECASGPGCPSVRPFSTLGEEGETVCMWGGGGGGRWLIHGRCSLTLMTQRQSEEESSDGKVDGMEGRGRKMSWATHRRLLANHKRTIKVPQCIAPQVCKSAASFAAATINASLSHSHTP